MIDRGNMLAIDPGTYKSGFVLVDCGTRKVIDHGILRNDEMLCLILDCELAVEHFVIEMIACFGMPVGKDVFETVYWIGRFDQVIYDMQNGTALRITRHEVKRHLCHQITGITDSILWQRLVDLYGPGKDVAVGHKNSPGPLYGIKSHARSALAVACTAMDRP